jgi:glutamine cyclotransferase
LEPKYWGGCGAFLDFPEKEDFRANKRVQVTKSKDPITADIFNVAYKHTFNTADRLNHFFYKKKYPFRREGWQYSFDDFHSTSLLWNTYVLWHEHRGMGEREKWKTFCQELARELI